MTLFGTASNLKMCNIQTSIPNKEALLDCELRLLTTPFVQKLVGCTLSKTYHIYISENEKKQFEEGRRDMQLSKST